MIPPKPPKIFKAPQSMIEFERDWGRAQQSDEDLYHYIKVKQL